MISNRKMEIELPKGLRAGAPKGFAVLIIMLTLTANAQMLIINGNVNDIGTGLRDEMSPEYIPPATDSTRDYALPKAKNITFYLHNTTTPTGELGEYQVLNTSFPSASSSGSLTSKKVLNEDWALNPPLANDVYFNGTGEAKIWFAADSPDAPTNLYINITEVDSANNVVQTVVPSTSPSPIPTLTTTAQEVTFSLSTTPKTIQKGHYIRAYIYLDGDASTYYTILWTPSTPSHINLSLEEHLDVASAMSLNSSMAPMTGFAAGAANKTIYIRGNITDPFGGYDIRWVNVTIHDPSGAEIVSNASMELVEGYYNTYTSMYQYEWNYSSQPSGIYNVTIYAVDNSGFYYRFIYGNTTDNTFGAHIAWKNISFSVGLEFFVNLQILDSTGIPLQNATVYTTDFGYMISNTTNASGDTNISVPGGNVTLKVIWQDAMVGNMSLSITENITYSNRMTMYVDVFYPCLKVTDNLGIPLSNASLFITHPNGSYNTVPYKTNSSGGFYLGRTAGGNYRVLVKWRGVDVNLTNVLINGNKTFTINTSVYHFTIYALDSGGNGLSGAQVVISNSSSHIVFDSKISDMNGMTMSVLPGGDYDITIYWRETQVYLNTTYHLNDNLVLYAICDIFSVTINVIDVRFKPVVGAQVVIETSGSMVLDSSVTDLNGQIVSSLPAGTHTVQVYWHDTLVYNSTITITDNSPKTLTCDIFYLNITVVDKHPLTPQPLAEAEIIIYDSFGNVDDRLISDSNGTAETRLPIGSYNIEVKWKGVIVNLTSDYYLDLGTQALWVECDVFYLDVIATDHEGIGLDNATITSTLANENSILATGKTDRYGKLTLRLPSAQYNITVSWLDVMVGEIQYYLLNNNGQLLIPCAVYYFNITTVDTHSNAIEGASVEITSSGSGRTLTLGQTDVGGNLTARVPGTLIDIWIYWHGHLVNYTGDLLLDLTQAESGLVINCSIYYITLQLRDSKGIPVENATVTLSDMSGQYISTHTSDVSGNAIFKAPIGNFSINVVWEGVNVAYIGNYYFGDMLDPVIVIDCSIYYLTIEAVDSEGYPLNDATVVIKLNTTDKLMFSDTTDTMGNAVARLPAAGYDIFMRWMDVNVYTYHNYTLLDESNGFLHADCSVYYARFHLIDVNSISVEEATVTVNLASTHNTLASGITDRNGNITVRLPSTTFDITAVWNTVIVNQTMGYTLRQSISLDMLCSIYYLRLRAVDSTGIESLPYAHFSLYLENGILMTSASADIDGETTIRLPADLYTIDVTWQDIMVLKDYPYTLTNNNDLILMCHVYYLTLNLTDMAGEIVADAEVRLNLNDTGQVLGTGVSDNRGQITLRLPSGIYDISVTWQGLGVYTHTNFYLTDNDSLDIACRIYYVEVNAKDSKGNPLSGAKIFAQSTATGHILGTAVTDGKGKGVLRLPAGEHRMDIYWQDTLIYEDKGYNVAGSVANLHVTYNCWVYYLTLNVIDDDDVTVVGGVISISRAGTGIGYGKCTTDNNGSATVRLPMGPYDLNIVWQGVVVNTTLNYDLNGDSELTIHAWIYYLKINATDDMGIPIENADVTIIRTVSGEVYFAGTTDGHGAMQVRLPKGNYDISIGWQDTIVYAGGNYSVTSSHTLDADCKVYYLTVIVKDSDEKGLKGVHITIASVGGEVIASNYTNKDGKAMFRLPANTYMINASYRSTYHMSKIDLYKSVTSGLTESTTLELRFKDYPPAIYSTNTFLWILGLVILLIVIIGIFYIMLKKRKEKPPMEDGTEAKETAETESPGEEEISEFEEAEDMAEAEWDEMDG